MPALTPVVRALLIANVAIFALQMVAFDVVADWFALWPLALDGSRMDHAAYRGPHFWLWQLVSYGFLHGGGMHLFFNMFALWMFGSQLERLWGPVHLLGYYFVCLVGAGVVQLVIATTEMASTGSVYPTLGASGAVFGLLLGFGMMFPNVKLMLLFLPIPIKAKYFVIGYGLLELSLGVMTHSAVAHFAHIGGMAFGFVIIQYWRGRLPWKPRYRLNR